MDCGLWFIIVVVWILRKRPLEKGSSHPPPVVQWRRHDADGSSASANLDQLTGNINVKKTGTMSLIQLFTVVRTDTTLDLSQKAEKVWSKQGNRAKEETGVRSAIYKRSACVRSRAALRAWRRTQRSTIILPVLKQ